MTNDEKAMLERLWIGIARQMDDEFQQVLEDLRGMCDSANSFAARLPSSRVAQGLVTIRLNEWHAHFTKYLEVASAHPLSTSSSYVEALAQVIKHIEEAREIIQGPQGREAGQVQESVPPRSPTANEQAVPQIKPRKLVRQGIPRVKNGSAPREQGGSTGNQQPPAPVVQQEDPLQKLARMREQEQKEIIEHHKKMHVDSIEHQKRMAEIQRKGNEALRQQSKRRWRR